MVLVNLVNKEVDDSAADIIPTMEVACKAISEIAGSDPVANQIWNNGILITGNTVGSKATSGAHNLLGEQKGSKTTGKKTYVRIG